jgi:hypothetical protein
VKRQLRCVISNPVPTADEMGRRLGLCKDRVEQVRKIMTARVLQKKVQ